MKACHFHPRFLFIIKHVVFYSRARHPALAFTLINFPSQATWWRESTETINHNHHHKKQWKFVLAIVVLFLCKAKARRVSSWVWLKLWNVLAPVPFCWWTTHVQHGKLQTGLNKWGASHTGPVIVKVARRGCCSSVRRPSIWVSHPLSRLRPSSLRTVCSSPGLGKTEDDREVTQQLGAFPSEKGKWRQEKLVPKYTSTQIKTLGTTSKSRDRHSTWLSLHCVTPSSVRQSQEEEGPGSPRSRKVWDSLQSHTLQT